MSLFNWHYRTETESGIAAVLRVEETPGSAPTTPFRTIVGEPGANDVDGPGVVFRSVRGNHTYANLALRSPASLPLDALRSYMRYLAGSLPKRQAYARSSEWTEFGNRARSLSASSSSAEALSALSDVWTIRPDRRLGLANLVPAINSAACIDGLRSETTGTAGSPARVVGELIEIWCLNALYKDDRSDTLLAASHSLVHLIEDPDDVHQTWLAHLARNLAMGTEHWRAHIRAIDVAHEVLANLWDRHSPIGLRTMVLGRGPA